MSMAARPCPPDLSVTLCPDSPSPPCATTEQRITAAWEAEARRRGGRLFNGRMLSLVDADGPTFICRLVEYRWFVAQWNDPSLFAELRVRPLAVSGLLRCPDGLAFGLRSATTLQDAGRWELVPSGGIDASSIGPGNIVDAAGQLLTELEEELGLTRSSVSTPRPFALIEDETSHVCDIAWQIETALTASELQAVHRAGGSGEYVDLVVVRPEELETFLGNRTVSAASRIILDVWEGDAPP